MIPPRLEPGETVLAQGQAAAHVAERQAGPAGQVSLRGRAVAPEVAVCELAQGLVAPQPPRVPHPLREQHVGLLPATDGAEHEHPGLGEVPQEVIPALAVDDGAARGDRGQQGCTIEGSAAFKRRDDRLTGPPRGRPP